MYRKVESLRARLVDGEGPGISVALLLMICPLLYGTTISMLAPLLVVLAREFSSTVPALGQIVAATSLAWAPAAILFSPFSDRFGRKPLIVFGLLGLGLTTFCASFAQSLPILFGLRLLGGLAGGALGPSVNAAVIDYYPPERRGQALGFVTAGMALSAVIGAPGVAMVSAAIGWRGGFQVVAVLLILLALTILWLLPSIGRPRRADGGHLIGYLQLLRLAAAKPLLLANLSERMLATALVTYLPAYLMLRYHLPLGAVGLLLSIIAVGALAGTLAGGLLADQPNRPRTFALCQTTATGIALPLLLSAPGVMISMLLGLGQAFASNLSRPSFMWMVGQLSPRRRGAVMGLYALTNQSGMVLGSVLGGVALGFGGYPSLAVLIVGGGALAVTIALTMVREDHLVESLSSEAMDSQSPSSPRAPAVR